MSDILTGTPLARRDFLKSGGALIIGFTFAGMSAAEGQSAAPLRGPRSSTLPCVRFPPSGSTPT